MDVLRSENMKESLAILLLSLPVLLFSLVLHELAHGYVAYRCGDRTAKNLGRLTLNPAKHLDLMGTLCMLLVGFGWAKPVPIILRNFGKPRRDLMLVAFAGPLTNLLIAFISTPLLILVAKLGGLIYSGGSIWYTEGDVYLMVTMMLRLAVTVNISLALFNLIPIPPLDGSRIVTSLLSPKLAMRYVQIERYAPQIVFAVVIISNVSGLDVFYPLQWLSGEITDLFMSVFEFLW